MPKKGSLKPIPVSHPARALTAEEKARLEAHGWTEEEVARNPFLRYAGAFKDDATFWPMMQRVFRESRGRAIDE